VKLPRVAGCLNRAPARRGRILGLFLGTRGLRAGWRAALYVALWAVFAAIGVLLVIALWKTLKLPPPQKSHGGLLITPMLMTVNELAIGVPVVLASLLMAWLEGCSWRDFGLRGTAPFRRFGFGVAAGLVSLGALLAILLAGHCGRIALANGSLRYGLEWALVCLAIGFVEEYGFRGYLLQALGRGIGFWPSALATSLLFGILHGTNPGETPVGLVTVGMIGFVFCLSRARTGALWWAIGFHATWDYAELFLAGSRNSGIATSGAMTSFEPQGNFWVCGGATGPEGSVLCVVVVAVVGIAVWRSFK